MKATKENRKIVLSIIKSRGHEKYRNLCWQSENVAYWYWVEMNDDFFKFCEIVSHDEIDMFIKKSKRKQKLLKLNFVV